MGHFESGYALGDDGGAEVFLQGADLDDAVTEASRIYGPAATLLYDGDLYSTEREAGRMAPNRSAEPATMPRAAHRSSGLGTYSLDEVMSLSEAAAHRKLKRFFVHFRHGPHKGAPIARYQTVGRMRSSLLTTNAKMDKASKKSIAGLSPGLSRGANLLPHALAAELSRKKLGLGPLGLCVGSNAACRSTCLLYSGQNPLADRQVPIKLARTEALLKEPVAWLRMFVAAVQWHADWCARRGLRAYLRPNLLSDIPWERICPELIEQLQQVRWYDYTKVAGRPHDPSVYDLTFSFNGTNEKLVRSELRRGVRAAVVFWLPRPCGRRRPPCDRITDLEFLGQPVLDGDVHDFRPLDPLGSVVGLTYKPVVTGATGRVATRPPPSAHKFVVPVFRDPDSGALLVAGTPAQQGAAEAFESQGPTELEVA